MTASNEIKSRLNSIAIRAKFQSEGIDKEMSMSEVALEVNYNHLRVMADSLNRIVKMLEEEEREERENQAWLKAFSMMSPEEKRRAR